MPDAEFLNYITFLRQRAEAGAQETVTIPVAVTIPAGKAPAPGAFLEVQAPFSPRNSIVCTTASLMES